MTWASWVENHEKYRNSSIILIHFDNKFEGYENLKYYVHKSKFTVSECGAQGAQEVSLTTYHNYIELEDEMKSLWNSYPSLSKLYAIGKTVEERALIVMQISQV